MLQSFSFEGTAFSIALTREDEDDFPAASTGTSIWPAAVLLCQYLEFQYTRSGLSGLKNWLGTERQDSRVLEIGCGQAIPSIYLAKLGVSVLATDRDPEVLLAVRASAERNGIAVASAPLKWPDRLNPRTSHRCILAADIIYNSLSAVNVWATVAAHLEPGGFFLYSHVTRDPMIDALFLTEASQRGFQLRSLSLDFARQLPSCPYVPTSALKLFEFRHVQP